MTFRFSSDVRTAMMDSAASYTALANPAVVRLYTGGQPASTSLPATGTLVAAVPLNNPGFAPAALGVLTLDVTPQPTAAAAVPGVIGWFRMVDFTGSVICDGQVTIAGGGGDMIVNTVTVLAGADVNIVSGSITLPE
jgi:hypothetical protein